MAVDHFVPYPVPDSKPFRYPLGNPHCSIHTRYDTVGRIELCTDQNGDTMTPGYDVRRA